MKLNIIALNITAGLVAGCQLCAFAEAAPEPPPPPKWETAATLGFSLTSGNSDTLLLTAIIKTQKKGPVDEWGFGADGAYGETDSTVNNNNIHGYGQYNRLFGQRWYAYARADALYDAIADVNYRITISPGAGYYLIKEKDTSLAAELGPGLVTQNLGGDESTYATLRVAGRFEHKFSEHARMWAKAEYLPQFSDFGNYLLNGEIGLGATLTKKLELTVILQDNYASEPAADKKNNDLKLITGITYKF